MLLLRCFQWIGARSSRGIEGRVRLVGTVMDVTREAAGVRVRLKVNTYQAAVVLPGAHACLQHFVRPGPVRRRVFRVVKIGSFSSK